MVRLHDEHERTDDRGGREPLGNGSGPSLEEPGPDRLASLSVHLEETVDLAMHLLRLRAARMRLRAQRRVVAVLAFTLFFVVAALASFRGLWLVARGLATGLGELLGRPWLGELLAGVALLGATALGLLVANRLGARRVLRDFQGQRDEAA